MNDGDINSVIVRLAARHLIAAVQPRLPGWPTWILAGAGGVLWRVVLGEKDAITSRQESMGILLLGNGQDWDICRPADVRTGVIRMQLEAISHAIK